VRKKMTREGDNLVVLREDKIPDTLPPPPGEPPYLCRGLENVAVEIGILREQQQWTCNALVLIANHLHVDLPPIPRPKV
jgi:hypothetical protein